jgi:rubrerythrin
VAALTRGDFLRGSGRGIAAVLVAASPARAAAPPSDHDLAYARLFVTAELLAVDFYRRAVRSGHFAPAERQLRRALANERDHYRWAASVLVAAGQAPATAADVDFVYPKRAFASRGATAEVGVRLESLFLHAYLGAVGALDAEELRLMAARIAASEARHLSAMASEVDGDRIGVAAPASFPIDRVSNELDAYTA